MANRFVSFLKKAGQLIVSIAPVAEQFIPALAPFLNLALPQKAQATATAVESRVESEISLMSQSVMAAETMANVLASKGTTITGAQKAAAAGTGVFTVLLNTESMVGKKIADPAAAQAAAARMAGDLADFWNAVDGSVLPNVPAAPLNPPLPAPTTPSI